MAGLEDKYRHDKVIPELRAWGFDVQHHEDRVYADIPDLSFAYGSAVDGWIELKYSQAGIPTGKTKFWPKTLTQGQVDWLHRRAGAGGGKCYILWGSPGEHALMRIDLAVVYLNRPASDGRSAMNRLPGMIIKPSVRDLIKTFRLALGGR